MRMCVYMCTNSTKYIKLNFLHVWNGRTRTRSVPVPVPFPYTLNWNGCLVSESPNLTICKNVHLDSYNCD